MSDEMRLPHDFQVQAREPQDTRLLAPDGKKIFRNPEPIGYVKPKDHQKFVVK